MRLQFGSVQFGLVCEIRSVGRQRRAVGTARRVEERERRRERDGGVRSGLYVKSERRRRARLEPNRTEPNRIESNHGFVKDDDDDDDDAGNERFNATPTEKRGHV